MSPQNYIQEDLAQKLTTQKYHKEKNNLFKRRNGPDTRVLSDEL